MMDGALASLIAAGASRNTQGRIYEPGKAYGLPVKLEVAEKYHNLKNASGNGQPPSARVLAAAADVSPSFALKIIDEIDVHGRVLPPGEIERDCVRGVGSIALDDGDERFLLHLRFVDPSRTNRSYVEWLHTHRGTLVSESFISDWFKNRFQFSGSFRSSSIVPIDKFKPANIARYQGLCSVHDESESRCSSIEVWR